MNILRMYHTEYEYLKERNKKEEKIFFVFGDRHVGKKHFVLSFINSDIKKRYENASISKIENISEKIFSSKNIIILEAQNISKFTISSISYYIQKIIRLSHIKAVFFIISQDNYISQRMKCFIMNYPNIYLAKIKPYTKIAEFNLLTQEKKNLDKDILFISHGRIGTFFYLKNFDVINNFLVIHKYLFSKKKVSMREINQNIHSIIQTDIRIAKCLHTYIDDVFSYIYKISKCSLYKSNVYFMFGEIKFMTERYNMNNSNLYIPILQHISEFLVKKTNVI